jgi:drug/metabolite transporter (DMT)-like permease
VDSPGVVIRFAEKHRRPSAPVAECAVVITYVAPAVAVAAGVTMLSEPLDARIALSFVLILCGSCMATGRSAPTVQPRRGRP